MGDTMPPPADTKRQAHRAPHSCSGCETRWSGARIAHCAECHRTFTTPANFDKHRAGSKVGKRVSGECHDPAVCGLVLNERRQWAMPGQPEVD